MKKFLPILLILGFVNLIQAQTLTGGTGNPQTGTGWSGGKAYGSGLSPGSANTCNVIVNTNGDLQDSSTNFMSFALTSLGISQAAGWQFDTQTLNGFYSIDRYRGCAGGNATDWPGFTEGDVTAIVPPRGVGNVQAGMELGVTYSGDDPDWPGTADVTTHWLVYCSTNSESVAKGLNGGCYFKHPLSGYCYFIWNGGQLQQPYFDLSAVVGKGSQFKEAFAIGGTPNINSQWYITFHIFRAWDDLDPTTGNNILHVSTIGFRSGFMVFYL